MTTPSMSKVFSGPAKLFFASDGDYFHIMFIARDQKQAEQIAEEKFMLHPHPTSGLASLTVEEQKDKIVSFDGEPQFGPTP